MAGKVLENGQEFLPDFIENTLLERSPPIE